MQEFLVRFTKNWKKFFYFVGGNERESEKDQKISVFVYKMSFN